MLHILNKGRNPFPHLKGKGGLYYHPSRKIIGGMIGGEENQIKSYLSPEDLQLYNRLNEQLAPKQTNEDEEDEDEEPVKKLESVSQPIQQLKLLTLDELSSVTIPIIKEQLDHYKIPYKSKEKKDELLSKLQKYLESKKPKKEKIKEKITPLTYANDLIDNYIEEYNSKYNEIIEKSDNHRNSLDTINELEKEYTVIERKEKKEIKLTKEEEKRKKEIFQILAPHYKTEKILFEDLYKLVKNIDQLNEESIKKEIKKNVPKISNEEINDIFENIETKFYEFKLSCLNDIPNYLEEYNAEEAGERFINEIEKMKDEMSTLKEQIKASKILDKQRKEKAEEMAAKEILKANKKENKKMSKEEMKKMKDESIKLFDEYIKLFPDDVDTQAEIGNELAQNNQIISDESIIKLETKIKDEKERLEEIREAKQKTKNKQLSKGPSKDIDQNQVNRFISLFKNAKQSSKFDVIKQFEDAYDLKMITKATLDKIQEEKLRLYKEFDEANKSKPLSSTKMKKAINEYGTTHGAAFEQLITTGQGANSLKLLTDSDSEIHLTDSSPNIAKDIILPNGYPLNTQCVIDAYNDVSCFEFKMRKKLKYKNITHIGLTTTKLGSNKSFKLLFEKIVNKFKVINVDIMNNDNIIDGTLIKQLFTHNVSNDYYAIFILDDGLYYYDILDDMTDDLTLFTSKDKNILVEQDLDGNYQYKKCNYPIIKTEMGLEYNIPKEKFKPMPTLKSKSKKKTS
jgi:hypothetical protein